MQEYGNLTLDSDIMRSKLHALLLQVYTILGESPKRENQLNAIQKMLLAVRAELSRALLLVTLYGCTDNRLYYDGIEKSFAEELALAIDEAAEDVKIAVDFLLSNGWLVEESIRG